jgi:septin family protein
VPVAKNKEPKILITEVEIAYDTLWQKQHFKAIESAYRRSPFYEYYIDDLMIFFNSKHRYLYDFNMQIMHKVCSLINISPCIQESSEFVKSSEEIIDLRNSIHPKITCTADIPRYTQVFADKWGFKPNLSILDLIFNVGPETKNKLPARILL